MKTALSIAGSDSSGGAGIQADIKTMMANGVYAMCAITTLTAQNTTGVLSISDVSAEFMGQQLDAVFTDIFPDAVKIGMVSSAELIKIIAERLRFYKAKNIVIDPVMIATSGSHLIADSAVAVLKKELLPQATLVTPNMAEAEALTGIRVQSKADMLSVAKIIYGDYGCSVLVKGGHRVQDADDLLYAGGEVTWFTGERVDNPNTHGTGCTLSSAIASNLAKGYDLATSVGRAKEYLTGALRAGLDLGNGSGPLNHGYAISCPCTEGVM